MSRYRLSRRADRDLDEILEYVADRSPDAAVRILEALEETFRLLASSPLIGTLREDLRPNLRVFRSKRPADKYLVFFYPLSDGVEISTVIHGARDYLGMFLRGER